MKLTVENIKKRKEKELKSKAAKGALVDLCDSVTIKILSTFSLSLSVFFFFPITDSNSFIGAILLFIGYVFIVKLLCRLGTTEPWCNYYFKNKHPFWFFLESAGVFTPFFLAFYFIRKNFYFRAEKAKGPPEIIANIDYTFQFLSAKASLLEEEVITRINKSREILNRVNRLTNSEIKERISSHLNSQILKLTEQKQAIVSETEKMQELIGVQRREITEELAAKQLLRDLSYIENTKEFIEEIDSKILVLRNKTQLIFNEQRERLTSLAETTQAIQELEIPREVELWR